MFYEIHLNAASIVPISIELLFTLSFFALGNRMFERLRFVLSLQRHAVDQNDEESKSFVKILPPSLPSFTLEYTVPLCRYGVSMRLGTVKHLLCCFETGMAGS